MTESRLPKDWSDYVMIIIIGVVILGAVAHTIQTFRGREIKMVKWIPTTSGLIQTSDISTIKICQEGSENDHVYKVLAVKDKGLFLINEFKTKEEAESFVYFKLLRSLNE